MTMTAEMEPALAVDEGARVRQAPRTAARTVQGKAVVVVIDSQRVHALNRLGSRIWDLADGRSIGEIADLLVAEYEVDRGTALADIRAFVAELQDLGAIELTVGSREVVE